MSLEDLSSDFLSDCSDHEAEESPTGGDEADYQELVALHGNLTHFGHIYTNNAIIDLQSEEDNAWFGLDADSDSALNLNQDFIHSVLEDPAQSSFQDYIQLYEAVFGGSPPSSSDSSDSSNTDSVEREEARLRAEPLHR